MDGNVVIVFAIAGDINNFKIRPLMDGNKKITKETFKGAFLKSDH